MQNWLQYSVLLLCFYMNSPNALAQPWFTGPLLAPAGHTVPGGHTSFEVYGLDVQSNGAYNPNGRFVRSPLFSSFVISPILTHGITDWLDVQLITPYTFNNTRGQSAHRLGDVSVAFGIQFMEQGNSVWKPDFRIFIQEVFPTGAYQHLNPTLLGTDSTGLGTYETLLGFNFQLLSQVLKTHYLRTRLILSHSYTSPITVHGLNTYGGTQTTAGRINSGFEDTVDVAFEFTLTQNWVAVLEGYYTRGNDTRFDGYFEAGNVGGPSQTIQQGPYKQVGFAPAVEYNFSEHFGLIGGVWFSAYGINTSKFTTYTLAVNTYW